MRIERRAALVVTVCLAVLLSACVGRVDGPQGAGTPPPGAQGVPPEWTLQNGRALPLDTVQSRITLRVYRAGRLARLGHNHVLEVKDLRGRLKQLEAGGGLAELVFGVAGIVVDDAAARIRAGSEFATQPSTDAVAGTRRNMLGEKVLDALNWPEVEISARVADLEAGRSTARVFVRVRGISRGYAVPVRGEVKEGEIRVSGSLSLRQSEFGITPFSVLGGALQVQDEIHADFLIVGRKSGVAM